MCPSKNQSINNEIQPGNLFKDLGSIKYSWEASISVPSWSVNFQHLTVRYWWQGTNMSVIWHNSMTAPFIKRYNCPSKSKSMINEIHSLHLRIIYNMLMPQASGTVFMSWIHISNNFTQYAIHAVIINSIDNLISWKQDVIAKDPTPLGISHQQGCASSQTELNAFNLKLWWANTSRIRILFEI